MTTTQKAGTAGNVLATIKSKLRDRPVWSARELRNAVAAIAATHDIKFKEIAAACCVDDSTVSKAFRCFGPLRGVNQFDYIAIALDFTPCGEVESRTYKHASIDRVAA